MNGLIIGLFFLAMACAVFSTHQFCSNEKARGVEGLFFAVALSVLFIIVLQTGKNAAFDIKLKKAGAEKMLLMVGKMEISANVLSYYKNGRLERIKIDKNSLKATRLEDNEDDEK